MKKILVTASTFPRWENDSEPKFIYDLCLEYAKYYDVTVLVPRAPGAKEQEEMEGIHVIRYPYFPIKKFETLAYPGAIVPRIKEKKIRILLVPFLFLGMFLAIKKQIKNVDYVHANWIIPQGIVQPLFSKPFILSGLGGDVTSLNKGFIKKLKKRAISQASAVTVVSKDLKKVLESEYGRDDIGVIPMGVDLTKFGIKYRQENLFDKKKTKLVILFVGRLAEKKGATYLIDAMRELDATLIIVGDGPEKDRLIAQSKLINRDIRFIGPKSKEELVKIYASCDIFCMPSVIAKDGDKDGLPVALLEAMASGAPVVATNVGGIKEVITNNINGLLVEPNDEQELIKNLKKLLEDKELRETFSKKARISAEAFDFVEIGKAYKKLFKDKI